MSGVLCRAAPASGLVEGVSLCALVYVCCSVEGGGGGEYMDIGVYVGLLERRFSLDFIQGFPIPPINKEGLMTGMAKKEHIFMRQINTIYRWQFAVHTLLFLAQLNRGNGISTVLWGVGAQWIFGYTEAGTSVHFRDRQMKVSLIPGGGVSM